MSEHTNEELEGMHDKMPDHLRINSERISKLASVFQGACMQAQLTECPDATPIEITYALGISTGNYAATAAILKGLALGDEDMAHAIQAALNAGIEAGTERAAEGLQKIMNNGTLGKVAELAAKHFPDGKLPEGMTAKEACEKINEAVKSMEDEPSKPSSPHDAALNDRSLQAFSAAGAAGFKL